MASTTIADRSLITISGPDAQDFLQGILTTDVETIGPDEAWPGALLSPQGKILYEFLIWRSGEGFVLETDAGNADAFIKRLTLYRLRAKVDIQRSQESSVSIFWDDDQPTGALADMRFAKAGVSLVRVPGSSGNGPRAVYTALKIDNGISGGAEDGDAGDYFPHDLLMDRNGGINFKKGCYIGQEVVSRMQHRATARRRLVTMVGASPLAAPGTPVVAGGREIGSLRVVEGNSGLAVVRIDKAGSALAAGEGITVGDTVVTLTLPSWSGLEFPTDSADEVAS